MGSIVKAAKTGNRLKALTELRDLLAERLDAGVSDRELASISRQFIQVTAEIEAIEGTSAAKTVSLEDFRRKLRVAK